MTDRRESDGDDANGYDQHDLEPGSDDPDGTDQHDPEPGSDDPDGTDQHDPESGSLGHDRVLDATSMDRDAPLAAVVAKPRAEVASASLRDEGVYDDDRRVRPFDADTVALPITTPPERTGVRDVIRQPDPVYRSRDLADHLRERDWTPAEIERAPGSWSVVGTVVRVTAGDYPRERELGDALLDLHGDADTVIVDEGISGTYRTPDVRTIAGVGDTETVHVEHGTRYALDVAKVMFSPGNQAERVHMGAVVEPGERVFDMFAGIGYFALPMARAGADVTAVELNPEAYRFLVENARLNDVTDHVHAILGDCRDVETTADRVVMGYYGVSETDEIDSAPGPSGGHATATDEPVGRTQEAFDYLQTALDALDGSGTLHVHAAVHESELPDGPANRVRDAVTAVDPARTVTVDAVRGVKSHSAGVAHVVVDATVD